MYKIIAIDADGTLLDDNLRIGETDKAAIRKAQEKGVYVALCSGRTHQSLNEFADILELDPRLSYIISFNGGTVLDGNRRKLRDVRMNGELARYIIRKLKSFEAVIAVYTEADVMLCEKAAPEIAMYTSGVHVTPAFVDLLEEAVTTDAYKVIVFGEFDGLREIADYMQKNAVDPPEPYDMVFSGKRLLEFSSVEATKDAGLGFVCEALGFDISKDAVAIGDNFNDISMLKAAALGAAMYNAPQQVKAVANYVTLRDNNNGGVAEVIQKFVIDAAQG